MRGYQFDLSCFALWINIATDHGIRQFYVFANWCDYPPFNVYLFAGFGSLAKALGLYTMSSINYVTKSIPSLFDLATASLIYVFVRKWLNFKQSLLTTALYAFNPAVIFNAAVWGQFDAIYTFFLVLSLMLAFKSRPKLSAVAFAIGILTKPQGIILAPLIALLVYKKNGLKNLVFSTLVFVGTAFLVALPFQWSNPLTFLSNIYFGGYEKYAVTSANAFNVWGLYGLWIPDGFLEIVGLVLFGIFVVFTLYFLHKRLDGSNEFLVIFGAFILFFAFFMLPTRIHERYLFPAISMLALMFPFMKKTRILYFVLTGTLLINQAYVLNFANNNLTIPNGNLAVLTISIINLIMLSYASALMWGALRGRHWLKAKLDEVSQNYETAPEQKAQHAREI
jgi:Gpi18-like mannosyltransferase